MPSALRQARAGVSGMSQSAHAALLQSNTVSGAPTTRGPAPAAQGSRTRHAPMARGAHNSPQFPTAGHCPFARH